MDETFEAAAEELENIAAEYEEEADEAEGPDHAAAIRSGNDWAEFYRSEASSYRRAAQHLRAAYENALEHE